jgi:hypothetical protein|tara:strand:- start:452 stop:1093 length:642 start_codon:yes stop_codon:yes gene_type:complete
LSAQLLRSFVTNPVRDSRTGTRSQQFAKLGMLVGVVTALTLLLAATRTPLADGWSMDLDDLVGSDIGRGDGTWLPEPEPDRDRPDFESDPEGVYAGGASDDDAGLASSFSALTAPVTAGSPPGGGGLEDSDTRSRRRTAGTIFITPPSQVADCEAPSCPNDSESVDQPPRRFVFDFNLPSSLKIADQLDLEPGQSADQSDGPIRFYGDTAGTL